MEIECDKFNLNTVHEHLKSALSADELDVDIEEYLKSYEELNKFFTLMGTVFGFVSSELKSKVETLRDILSFEHFTTVKSMINYEMDNQLLSKRGYTSASRTLLRLHRALDFIALFLYNIGNLSDEDSTANACREAYDQTLALHHSFVIRNAARVAMYTLPNRKQLLTKTCGTPEAVCNAIDLLPETLNTIKTVHQIIDNLYATYNLQHLP